jgi:hypothetical protein
MNAVDVNETHPLEVSDLVQWWRACRPSAMRRLQDVELCILHCRLVPLAEPLTLRTGELVSMAVAFGASVAGVSHYHRAYLVDPAAVEAYQQALAAFPRQAVVTPQTRCRVSPLAVGEGRDACDEPVVTLLLDAASVATLGWSLKVFPARG